MQTVKYELQCRLSNICCSATVFQCVSVCSSVLQCATVCSLLQSAVTPMFYRVLQPLSPLQWVAVGCSVVPCAVCGTAYRSVFQCPSVGYRRSNNSIRTHSVVCVRAHSFSLHPSISLCRARSLSRSSSLLFILSLSHPYPALSLSFSFTQTFSLSRAFSLSLALSLTLSFSLSPSL